MNVSMHTRGYDRILCSTCCIDRQTDSAVTDSSTQQLILPSCMCNTVCQTIPQQKDASLCHNMEQTHQSNQFLFTTPSAIPHAQFCPCRLPHNSTVSPDAVSTLHNSLQQFCLWTVSFACRTARSEGAWELVTSQARPMGQNRKTCEGTVLWGDGGYVKVVLKTDSVQFL